MNTNKATLIGSQGVKTLSLTNDAEWAQVLGREAGGGGAAEAFRKVAWLHRGVMLRAQAVSALPFGILKGGREVERSAGYANRVGFFPDPARLLALVEAALTLHGYAYLFVRRNRVRPLGVRYVDPGTVEPVIDGRAGLTGFTRNLNGQRDHYEVEDLVYFWGVDPFVEIGHPRSSPAKAALAAARVLMNVDEFASAFFQRGAIKATVFSAPAGIPEAERLRFRDWLRRFFGGGVETAHAIEVLNADKTEATVIGEGIHELADNALTTEKREDIATALGVPHSLLFSNAATYATARQDDLHFMQKTILPEAALIEQTLNDQLFARAGYRFEFRPEEMSAFQDEEVRRAEAFAHLAGRLPASLALRILGFDLPSGVSWEDIDAMEAAERVELADQDLARWKRKALKRLKRGQGAGAPFESEHIPAERQRRSSSAPWRPPRRPRSCTPPLSWSEEPQMPIIEIKGLEALKAKLEALASGRYLDGVLRAAQRRLLASLRNYPPTSAANRPKPAPGRWYQRGYGTRWARRGRTPGGAPTSEKMGAAWRARVSGRGLVLANRASYAPHVMGAKRQSGLHARRGWRRVDEILAEEAPRIEADLVRAVEEVLK